MARMRVRLTYPTELIQQPIVYHLVKDFGIVPNIRRADVRANAMALTAFGVPVLLVRGSRGFLDDRLVDELLERVPDSAAVTIESGHNVQEDAPSSWRRTFPTRSS